jgi:2-keto-4-pentenoate hydratase
MRKSTKFLRPVLMVGMALSLTSCASLVPDAATCPTSAEVATMVKRYVDKQALDIPPASMTMEGGQCAGAKFVKGLGEHYGKVVGYKAGLTNPVVQQRFNYNQPMRGVLLEKMLLPNGATVPARFGARPIMESDLIVEVGSSEIMNATTHAQVLAGLRSVRPFLELPDLILTDPSKTTGPSIAMINVGARLGVLGAAIPVAGAANLDTALRDMTVRIIDGTGKELNVARGNAILGHPLNAALWLVNDLKKAGITLKPGDLLSLGSFSPPLPVQAGTSARVIYEGLPGNPSVSVGFQ